MPHQNKHTTVIDNSREFYLAMLDLLPALKWYELHNIIQKTHYWTYQYLDCTTFTVAE
jgi:hypothetical protein